MPFVVERDDGVGIALGAEAEVEPAQRRQAVARQEPGKPQRFGIEQWPDRIDLAEFLDGQRPQEPDEPRDAAQPPLSLEPRKRFPKGRAADSEPRGEVDLVDPRAGG